jgi:ribonuclease BN (tRNA processing enzyme)
MEILFLGTGGGRHNMVSQLRRTAGFLILGSLRLHVDPGPGAILACKEFGCDPRLTDAVVVTHNHIDHVNDAALILEAMALRGRGRQGALIAPSSVAAGDEYGERAVSSYHLARLSSLHIAKHGKPIVLGSGGRRAVLLPRPVSHEDRTGFGFTLDMDGCRIGYTSDTEYFAGMGRLYPGCGLLIANNLKARKDSIPGHLCSAQAARLLSEAKPALCAITHMGMRLIEAGPGKEARKIQRASRVRTIAAKDGMRIRVAPGCKAIIM